MSAPLTESEFSQHLNTTFRVRGDLPRPVELELIEVKPYQAAAKQAQMERFSVYFAGPGDVHLPQGTYVLEHEQMGQFELFMVPIGRDERGFRYEAVFNFFR